MRNTIDLISLKDIDDNNEWLIGRMDGYVDEDAGNDRLHDDDLLTWGDVSRAAGVGERRFKTRASSSNRSKRATTSPFVALDHEEEANLEETKKEDDEAYKSNNGEDDDELFLDEEDH